MEFEAASMALAWVALLMDYGQFSRHRSLKDWIKLRVETFFVAMWNHDDDDDGESQVDRITEAQVGLSVILGGGKNILPKK